MNLSRRRCISYGTIAIAATLSNCRSPPAHYYRLLASPGPVLESPPMRVGVFSVSIPDDLNQNGIAYGGSGNQFDVYSNDLWAGRLAEMLQDVMVQNLAQRLPQATVIGSGGSIGLPFDVIVEINVLRFDPDGTGNVVLSAQISVKSEHGHGSQDTQSLTRKAGVEQNSASDFVAAMNRLWAAAADQIAAMITEADDRAP
jgi:uncharacterized lipoprotein YmbA